MIEAQERIDIKQSQLVDHVLRFKEQGYRLVQIGCTVIEGGFEINYSFAQGYKFVNLKMPIAKDEEVVSISPIYPSAFLYGNEIHDLFGVHVSHLSVDYNGDLYKTTVKTPFAPVEPASADAEQEG